MTEPKAKCADENRRTLSELSGENQNHVVARTNWIAKRTGEPREPEGEENRRKLRQPGRRGVSRGGLVRGRNDRAGNREEESREKSGE